MRKIHTVTGTKATAKVYRNTEWNEYVVKWYYGDIHNVDADYHTDCRSDAMDTANNTVN